MYVIYTRYIYIPHKLSIYIKFMWYVYRNTSFCKISFSLSVQEVIQNNFATVAEPNEWEELLSR